MDSKGAIKGIRQETHDASAMNGQAHLSERVQLEKGRQKEGKVFRQASLELDNRVFNCLNEISSIKGKPRGGKRKFRKTHTSLKKTVNGHGTTKS